MADFHYEITKELGILSTNARGWNKELNMVSWNDGKPKYDNREWAPDHERMGKGMTLNEDEAQALLELLQEDLASSDDEE